MNRFGRLQVAQFCGVLQTETAVSPVVMNS